MGLGPPSRPSDAHEHRALSLGSIKDKAFCYRPFALHRQQSEQDKQNVDVAPPPVKISRPWLKQLLICCLTVLLSQ